MSRVAASRAGPLHPRLAAGRDYPFVRLDRLKAAHLPPGVDPIDFGIGDPHERTPEFIRRALREAVPERSSYPKAAGLPELRAACARWAGRRFGVTLDPEREVLPANGAKEAVFLLAMAVVAPAGPGADPRRTVVIPVPAYPVYEAGAAFAGADVLPVPLRSEDGWRFRPERVPDEVWARTALLWLNSPHNPTGATLGLDDLARVAGLARRHGFWVAADEAYAEVWFDAAPPSMLQCGLENVIAFHTLSKRSAMTGYRSGFMAGDSRLIEALRRFRPNVGVATPEFVQRAAVAAWDDDAHAAEQRAGYAAKRRLFLEAFAARGWRTEASEAGLYLWWRAPGGDDEAFAARLLSLGVVTMPGSYLDPAGSGFLRLALVPTLDACREAADRLARLAEAPA